MGEIFYSSTTTPIGKIWVAANNKGICLLKFGQTEHAFCEEIKKFDGREPHMDTIFNQNILDELRNYFDGTLMRFAPPSNPKGTPFEMSVWKVVQNIPLGETRSYQEIAQMIGNPNACRAVGSAIGRNPIPLFIPCHRVIRKDGKLGGFSSGIAIKEWLLKFERKVALGKQLV